MLWSEAPCISAGAVGSFLVKFRYPIKNDVIAKGVQAGIEEYNSGAETVCSLLLSCIAWSQIERQAAAPLEFSAEHSSRHR